MRGAVGAMDAGGAGAGGGKRGDACLAEIQRLEKNRANRRNRMEKARLVVLCMCFCRDCGTEESRLRGCLVTLRYLCVSLTGHRVCVLLGLFLRQDDQDGA